MGRSMSCNEVIFLLILLMENTVEKHWLLISRAMRNMWGAFRMALLHHRKPSSVADEGSTNPRTTRVHKVLEYSTTCPTRTIDICITSHFPYF